MPKERIPLLLPNHPIFDVLRVSPQEQLAAAQISGAGIIAREASHILSMVNPDARNSSRTYRQAGLVLTEPHLPEGFIPSYPSVKPITALIESGYGLPDDMTQINGEAADILLDTTDGVLLRLGYITDQALREAIQKHADVVGWDGYANDVGDDRLGTTYHVKPTGISKELLVPFYVEDVSGNIRWDAIFSEPMSSPYRMFEGDINPNDVMHVKRAIQAFKNLI